jgi:hypothetical protein
MQAGHAFGQLPLALASPEDPNEPNETSGKPMARAETPPVTRASTPPDGRTENADERRTRMTGDPRMKTPTKMTTPRDPNADRPGMTTPRDTNADRGEPARARTNPRGRQNGGSAKGDCPPGQGKRRAQLSVKKGAENRRHARENRRAAPTRALGTRVDRTV